VKNAMEQTMEKTELLRRLEEVEQQLSNETEMITRQRKMLAEIDAREADTDAIKIMLDSLENLLVLHLQQREKLRAELVKLLGPS
jgi:hypothetical protein